MNLLPWILLPALVMLCTLGGLYQIRWGFRVVRAKRTPEGPYALDGQEGMTAVAIGLFFIITGIGALGFGGVFLVGVIKLVT